MTPTFPLPRPASGLSAAIAVKSRVKEFAVIDGTAAALLGLLELVEVGVPLLPHAAMTRAALPATAVRPTLLVTGYNETTSLMGGRVKDIDMDGCNGSVRMGHHRRDPVVK